MKVVAKQFFANFCLRNEKKTIESNVTAHGLKANK